MDLDPYPIWVVCKAVVLEVLLVPDEVVSPSEVAKLVPLLELLLVFWRYSDPESFHFESVSEVMARVRFESVV